MFTHRQLKTNLRLILSCLKVKLYLNKLQIVLSVKKLNHKKRKTNRL